MRRELPSNLEFMCFTRVNIVHGAMIPMSRMIHTTEALIDYVARVGAREHPALRRCREETARLPNAK